MCLISSESKGDTTVKKEKNGMFSKLFGGKKSGCCEMKIEEMPEEPEKETATSNSCCTPAAGSPCCSSAASDCCSPAPNQNREGKK
jgi:hypothetical protein